MLEVRMIEQENAFVVLVNGQVEGTFTREREAKIFMQGLEIAARHYDMEIYNLNYEISSLQEEICSLRMSMDI